MRIALCQYAPERGDLAGNLARSLEWLERAGEAGADLAILPELCTTGYTLGDGFLDAAQPVPGPATDAWGRVARKYGMDVIGGLARRHPHMESIVYNSAVYVDREGAVRAVHDKVILPLYLHTWLGEGEAVVIEEPEIFRHGDRIRAFDTRFGRVGMLVCQDAVYPEYTREMALQGARLVVHILNGPAVQTRHEEDITPETTRVHAFDNGVFIALCNRVGRERFEWHGREFTAEFYGASHVCDPLGNFVAKGPAREEALVTADVDLESVARAQWSMKLLRDWRPELLRSFREGDDPFYRA
ncbi:MAG: carbon-nitrogen hydrolase family protein [Firmicutes bacterium]|nr:carbon-nitrogen hydrolase family protein [Bacillota bacterium]